MRFFSVLPAKFHVSVLNRAQPASLNNCKLIIHQSSYISMQTRPHSGLTLEMLKEGCTISGLQAAVETQFCTVTSNFLGSFVCNLYVITLSAPRILR